MRYSINSSSIKCIDYDVATGILAVTLTRGATYLYHGVPESVVASFLSAPSKGQFYNQYIRGRYQ